MLSHLAYEFGFDPFAFHALPHFVVAVMIVAGILAASSWGSCNRQQRQRTAGRPIVCRACGTQHPPFARFCSRCGRKL